jgi:hypothetical protein
MKLLTVVFGVGLTKNINKDLELSLEQAYNGAFFNVTVDRAVSDSFQSYYASNIRCYCLIDN